MKINKSVLASLLLVMLCASSSAFAQGKFFRNHPRRAEVLGRDSNLRHDINMDRGNLHGQAGNLMAQDRRIRRQEQRDARMNGGHITQGEQRQLNREENRLHREVRRDY
jgi:hypothetical protein